MTETAHPDRTAEWDQLRSTYLMAHEARPASVTKTHWRSSRLGDYVEMLGGLHHLAISVEPDKCERLELISDPLGEMYGSPVL